MVELDAIDRLSNARLPDAAGCGANISRDAEDCFDLLSPPPPPPPPAGLKLIKGSSTPLKMAVLPQPLDMVQLKDIVCYLSLLEGGRPEDKLECECHPVVIIQEASEAQRCAHGATARFLDLRENTH